MGDDPVRAVFLSVGGTLGRVPDRGPAALRCLLAAPGGNTHSRLGGSRRYAPMSHRLECGKLI